ncbi:ferritin-like domain-containing protein [Rubellimicrobium aerolatum]|uniref:Ferritin-like domain-containing protein n=1 Tax=Rubellimicrobium aerolatum TaxID=490979 RepID=A0ABW0SGB1_9RHOB|nr:ferritin-like domain-containing protein [Rubellimicrobium aerolatum]MBP1807359.1 ferritin-like metal-binding protein YciE [Rubellimicrobium aerolatum]
MPAANLEKLFHDGLRDIYYAERKALAALKKQARAVSSPEFKQALEQHRDETEGQIERLQQVFETIGKRPQGKTCAAIDGLSEEGDEIMDEYKGSPALDAGLLGAAQAIEHYEICRYGTLASWAKQMGNAEAERLLRETLAEEEKTDKLLTELAESVINAAADQAEAA